MLVFYKALFYKYFIWLKRVFPSYLGIEDTASSIIIGTLFYLKILVIYLLINNFLINFIYFNDTVFYLLYLITLIYFYIFLVKKNWDEIEINFKNSEYLNTFKWTAIGIIYPILVIFIFVITIIIVLN